MKRFSWKYMAGMTDGEGCIDMQGSFDKRRQQYYCRPRFRMTLSGTFGKEMIDNFILNFGGCFDSKERQWENPHWLPAYTWILSGSTPLRAFLQNIVNHLMIKKEQAIFAIWWLDHVGGKKQVADEVRRFGTDEMKAMKRDPHRLSERATQKISGLMR